MRPAVWAPGARTVAIVLDSAEHPMIGRGDGWFDSPVDLVAGDRYAFRLDEGAPLPDPRSLSLPDGVHGPSEVVDPALFMRGTQWPGRDLRGCVLYELHIGTFTGRGTFDAAVERLDHLVDLGVDAVELMPVAAFPGERGWGYDGVGLFAVHEPYGGVSGLVRFVDACHERGLAVVLDVVHNHLGPEGNYLGQFGPYFTDRHETPWGEAVNLDGTDSGEVRRFLLDSARHWLVDVGVDGLRLDAVHALHDDSERHFLAELSDCVSAWEGEVGRPLTLIAESDLNQPSMVSAVGSVAHARGMDAQWADDVHHALHSFFGRETQGYYGDFGSIDDVVKALARPFVRDGSFSAFRGQLWGAPVDPSSPLYDGHSFVVFLQDHDQVGNRAVGDRFHQHAGLGEQAAGAALYLLSPYTPMLFMGEEWAASSPFPYFSDLGPELGPLVTEGRLREFAAMGWAEPTPDPQDPATARSAALDWEELTTSPHREMAEFYRRLLELRRLHPELRDPDLADVRAEVVDDDTVALHRGTFTITATRGRLPLAPPPGEVLASYLDGDGAGPGAMVTRRR